jgi:dTDP-glucose pyrophosphorylase/CBS domain-containing protein
MVAGNGDLVARVTVPPEMPVAQALARMDQTAQQILLVADGEGRLLGTVTDGDIRRALLRGLDLGRPVGDIMNRAPKTLPVGAGPQAVRTLMLRYDVRHVPLVDAQGRVVDLVVWRDLFRPGVCGRAETVVIMAGGQGTRLDPFTRVLPKPLIPLRDKPMVEVIMESFHAQGFGRFVLCLGYKADVVRLYFNGNHRPYRVDFVEEDRPLGTAGALGLLAGRLRGTFVLTNCDIIVELDAGELLRYHREKGHAITVVGAAREFTVPYGVLHNGAGGFRIEEKPNLRFVVNTGLYVLEPAVTELVGGNERIDMPGLISRAQERGWKVGMYRHDGPWFDVGQWDEYQRTLRLFSGMDGEG